MLSHRLNESLRVLTAFSVTLLPLTLLTGLFGMNVDLPGDGEPGEFWCHPADGRVLGSVLYFFRRRGYL